MVRRVIKKLLRPFAAPVYARLRILTREAVDQALQQEREAQARFLSDLSDMFGSLSAGISKDLQSCASLGDRLISLQLGLDAARQEIDSVKTLSSNAAQIAASHTGTLSEVSSGFSAMGQAVQNIASLTNVTLSRADVVLQRVAIPVSNTDLMMRTEDGFLMVPAEDGGLVAAMWESAGRLEPGTLRVLQALVGEGDTVVDIGANIGLLAIPIAKRVGTSGHVIAIEPASRVAELLRRSLALNGLSDRVTIHQCAVGEGAGSATLNIGNPSGHSSLLPLPNSVGTEDVRIASLDDLIEPGQAVSCVKIDAEGFEPQIWRGMKRVVDESPELVVIVEFGPEHLDRAHISIDDWLAPFFMQGFHAFEIDEATGQLSPIRTSAELAKVSSINLLFAKNPAALSSKLMFH